MASGECRRLCDQLNFRWHLNEPINRLFCSLDVPGASRNVLHLFRKIGELSESENHHPELVWFQGCLEIQVWTHKIKALAESDFILAAKIDHILAESDIQTMAFDCLRYEDLSLVSPEVCRGWYAIDEKGALYRQYSFGDFKLPWEYALKLLEQMGGSDGGIQGIELGYGHLGVRVGGLRKGKLADEISTLIKM